MSNAHGQDQFMAVANRLAAVERELAQARMVADDALAENGRLSAQLAALTGEAAVEAAAKALYLTGDLSAFETWEQQIPRYKQTYYDDARSILTAARAAATAREGA